MSKVYILYKEELNSEYDKADVVAVFSSYAAMLLWLKEVWGFESDIVTQAESCVYFSNYYDEQGVRHFLSYSVKDLIGETSHKTGKLVIKPH